MGCCFSARNREGSAADNSEIEINFNSLHSKDKKKSGNGTNNNHTSNSGNHNKRRKSHQDEELILNQCQLGLKSNQLRVSAIGSDNGSSAGESANEITGSGTILGSCPLDCDTARWEVQVVKGITSTDQLQIGIKRFYKHIPIDHLSQTLEQGNQNPASSSASNETISYYLSDSKIVLKENDVIGVYWDQTDLPMLQFTLNGELLFSASVNRIRPSNDIYVAVSLDGSKAPNGSFKIFFHENDFKYPSIASKFKMIICSTKLI